VPGAARAGSKRHPYRRRRNRYGRGRAQANGTPVLGAIDVGTNACRLLIAVPEHDASRGQMLVPRVIDSFTANVRLGESLERTGTITVAALDRTIAALKECAKRLKKRRVTHIKAIATEACRKATNAQDLVTRAQEEAGICLSIVTPEEEARLAAAGCVQLIGAEFDGALIFDIGGGSTELILVRRTAAINGLPIRHDILAWSSAPVGVVKLAERHGGRELRASSYPAMNAELSDMFSAMKSELEPEIFDAKRFHLLGTSGTLTTLAGIKLGLKRYERSRIDGQWLDREDIVRISDTIVSQDFKGRAAIPCIGTDRADLILPGCAILRAIMDNWPCGTLRVADRGLREGMLIALVRESQSSRSSVRTASS